jgi:hypothetical protein
MRLCSRSIAESDIPIAIKLAARVTIVQKHANRG